MDIDIDFCNRQHALDVLPHIIASRETTKGLVNHPTGVYFQNIPHNPITLHSNIDYKEAENRGYFKIDFLNVSIYENVKSEDHLLKLMNTEPIWELLEEDDFVNMIFHIKGHGAAMRLMKPKSVDQLAAMLAMIRPAKKHLLGKDWDTIMKEVWVVPENDDYFFKRSHSYSYAITVIVHMNLICESFNS